MSAFFFGNLWLLPALALASVPIIIHILNKRKHRVVDWGAMRFLLLSVTHKRRRVRIEEWLLLLLRTLLVVLLVLALSRLALTRNALSAVGLPDSVSTDPAALSDIVIVIDGGHSMQVRTGVAGDNKPDELETKSSDAKSSDTKTTDAKSSDARTAAATRFDLARKRVGKLLDETPPGHSVGIICAFDRPEVLAAPANDASAEALKTKLAAVVPYPCNADLQAAVGRGLELLTASSRPVKKLIIVTDGRRGGWGLDRLESWKRIESAINRMPSTQRGEFATLVLTLDDADGDNAADEAAGLVLRRVTSDGLVPVKRRVRVTAEIENVSSGVRAGWRAQLLVDGKSTDREVTLQPMEPSPRLRGLSEIVTTTGETLLGTLTSANDAEVKLSLMDGTERTLPRSEINAGPRRPTDLPGLLTKRAAEIPVSDGTGRRQLAIWAAAGGQKTFALSLLAERIKTDAGDTEAAKLERFIRLGRPTQTVRLDADGFETLGSHRLTVELLPPGATKAGSDARHSEIVPVRVVGRIPILVINGDPFDPTRHKARRDDEVFFLRGVLSPAADEAAPGKPKPTAPVPPGSEFAGGSDSTGRTPESALDVLVPDFVTRGQLRTTMTEAGTDDLLTFLRRRSYRVVVLANVDGLSAAEAAALYDFTAGGGGLLILPGDRTNPAEWNKLDWLPAGFAESAGKPLPPQALPPTELRGRRFDNAALQGSDLLAMLAANRELADASILRWWRLRPRTDGGATVLMSLLGGEPMIVSRSIRAGRAVMWAFPGDRDWTNLPASEHSLAYAVLVYELLFHLSGVAGENLRLRPNDEFVFALPEGFAPDAGSAKVTLPKRSESDTENRTADMLPRPGAGRSFLVFGATQEVGLYRMRVAGKVPTGLRDPAFRAVTLEQEFTVSTRIDEDTDVLAEDDRIELAKVLASDVTDEPAQQAARLFTSDPGKAAELVRKGSGPRAIWHMFAWLMVGLLFLEVLMTRRMASRFASGGGGNPFAAAA